MYNACRNGKANGGGAVDGEDDTAEDSNSDKVSKASNGNVVNGDIDDEGGGGDGGGCGDDNGDAEHVTPMESS